MVFDPNIANLPAGTRSDPYFGRSRYDATTAPTASDDELDGWSLSSLWYDSTAGKLYLCTDATAGAADWQEIPLGATAGAGGVIAYTASATPTEDGEETVHTVALSGGTMAANGDQLRLLFSGTTNSGPDGSTMRIYFDGNMLETTVIAEWAVDVTVTRTGSGSARLVGFATSSNGTYPLRMTISSGIVWTSTVNIDFNVWSEYAGTIVTGDYVSVEYIPII